MGEFEYIEATLKHSNTQDLVIDWTLEMRKRELRIILNFSTRPIWYGG